MSTAFVLERAVQSLCRTIVAEHIHVTPPVGERDLWCKLLECVLSSQVPFSLATQAAHRVTDVLFPGGAPVPDLDKLRVQEVIRHTLFTPFAQAEVRGRYRFPNLKSRQIADTWCGLRGQGRALRSLVYAPVPAESIRAKLIALVHGLGMKQASMLLRDIGISNDLAIIDRHILAYMVIVRLLEPRPPALTPDRYLRLERVLQTYAAGLGYALGIVDQAIWLIIRAAKKDGML